MDKYLEHSNEDYSEFISKSNDSDESINNEDKEARELADILTDNTAKRKAKVRKQREKNRKRMVEMKLQCPHCQTVYKEEEKNIIRRGLGEYPARANMQYWGRRKTKTRGGRRDRQEHHTIPIYLCGSLAQTPCSVTVAEHTRLHAELAGWAIALQTAEEYADRIFLGRRRSGRVLRLADTRIGRSLIAGALRQFYSFGWVGVGIPTIGSVFPIEAEEFVNGKTSLSRNCSRTGAPPPP